MCGGFCLTHFHSIFIILVVAASGVGTSVSKSKESLENCKYHEILEKKSFVLGLFFSYLHFVAGNIALKKKEKQTASHFKFMFDALLHTTSFMVFTIFTPSKKKKMKEFEGGRPVAR